MNAYHLRILCDNPWEGGGGYTTEQVANMTLDQIWFRLCDKDLLSKPIGSRVESKPTLMAASEVQPDEDGMVKGRAADGTAIKARIGGKSVARQLMEAEAERVRIEALSPRERRQEARKKRIEQRGKNQGD